MKRTLYFFGLILLTSLPVPAQSKFEITLKNNTPAEAKTKAQLERLIKSYDLEKWIFTRKIEIDEKAIPHSHPGAHAQRAARQRRRSPALDLRSRAGPLAFCRERQADRRGL